MGTHSRRFIRRTDKVINMKYKMIVSDYDGTLFRSDYTVSDRNISAIKDYTARGGRFVIATGRLFGGIRREAIALGLKGEIIAYQGTGIYDIESGEELYSATIDNDISVAVNRLLYDIGEDKCLPMVYYADDCYIKENNPYVEMFAGIVKIKPIFTGQRMDEFLLDGNKSPRKLLVMAGVKDIDFVQDKLKESFGDVLTISKSSPVLLEMVMKDFSKATAIEWLANRYGIKREEIITIGDSENDLPMIEYAGLGVAVDNAMDSVKTVADYIAPSNDDDGVAHVIEKFGN